MILSDVNTEHMIRPKNIAQPMSLIIGTEFRLC